LQLELPLTIRDAALTDEALRAAFIAAVEHALTRSP
jgi:hypothetical protein